MKIREMNISTQLRLGFGFILILVAMLCAETWHLSHILWNQTSQIYEHPFPVRRALGEIKADIAAIHLYMEELRRIKNPQEFQDVVQSIDTAEAHVHRQFDIVYQRYLGQRAQIDAAYQTFIQWKRFRDENIRSLGTKQYQEVDTIYDSDDDHTQRLHRQLDELVAFADNKAIEFYQTAGIEKEKLTDQLLLFCVLICILTTGILLYLQQSLRAPLLNLTDTARNFRRGKLDVRVENHSNNEFGTLAQAFNDMAATVQTELLNKETQMHMAEVMLREDEISVFCRNVLAGILQYTESQTGAVYLLDETETHYALFESIGHGHAEPAPIQELGKEFSLAVFTGQIQRITDIPPDTLFTVKSMTGTFLPREIVTIPILSGARIVAIISLASVKPFSAEAMRLINEIWTVLSARMNALLLVRKLHDFTARLEQQNAELEEQKREMASQSDELLEQNMELEMQKKQLDEANRLKSAFLSNMSHELRTPLNSVIALAGVLNHRLLNNIPEEEQSYLGMIERNGRQLLELINNILDLSRIEAGREDVNPSIFSVQELIANIISTLEPQAKAKNIQLLQDIAPDLPIMHSDFVKCRHILQNLVSNAVKFTSVGHVRICAHQNGSYLEIRVSDTGIGILANQIQFIFEEFRQGDESTTRNFGGTGLGLAIARKYALMLQGDISVVSEPGQGATFTLRLPVQPGLSTPSAHPILAAKTPQQGLGKKLLLVEDSEPAIIQLTDILTNQGYLVTVAKNGREALLQVAAELPDAMILDLMMPEVDGFKVLENVRSLKKSACLPVLILTAKHVTSEELSFLKGNHIHQLIQKGDINKNDLLSAIASMVFPPARTETGTTPRKFSGTPNILIVEDNPDNLATMYALLRDMAVLSDAPDGKIALDAIRTKRPDLILMDLSLPVMDGFACIAEIRKDKTLCDIPVIAVTASAMLGDKETILSHGFDAYVSKPVDFNVLVEAIHNVLTIYR